jgi:hypothetical protein
MSGVREEQRVHTSILAGGMMQRVSCTWCNASAAECTAAKHMFSSLYCLAVQSKL